MNECLDQWFNLKYWFLYFIISLTQILIPTKGWAHPNKFYIQSAELEQTTIATAKSWSSQYIHRCQTHFTDKKKCRCKAYKKNLHMKLIQT